MSDTIAPRCPNCGNEGPTQGRSFCEVCGDFVDWGEVASAARRAAAPPPPPATQAPASPAVPPAVPSPGRPAAPGTAASSSQPAATSGSGPSSGAERQSRARELLVPVGEDDVDPVLPGRPEARRPEVRPAVATEESGITCWNCGVGNRSDRRFCRNCGADLAARPAPVAASGPSWWARLTAWLRRRWILALSALALAALVVLGVLILPGLLAGDDEVVPPVAVEASRPEPDHPPASAVDDRPESWWGTGRGRDPEGAALTSNFERPFDLRSVRIVPGVSDRDEEREQEFRPQQIDITVENGQGREQTFSARLRDGGAQVVPTRVNDATRVTITVRSAYRSGGGNQVAISDIRFQGRRS